MKDTSRSNAQSKRDHALTAGQGGSPGFAAGVEKPFTQETRSGSAAVRKAWVSLDGMFKAIHESIGPVDHDRIRRRDALRDLLQDNGVEGMALLQILKELQPQHALDLAMAVEADARHAWNQRHVEAWQVAQAQMLHEDRLA